MENKSQQGAAEGIIEESRDSRMDKSVRDLLEKRLGLPPNLLTDLVKDDDWTFVVRLHAFVEACLNHAIVEQIGRPELARAIAFLPTSDSRNGKVEVARALGLIEEDWQCRLVTALSEVRNWMVHDVRNIGRSLNDYFSDPTDEKQQRRRRLMNALAYDVEGEGRRQFEEAVFAMPKRTLWRFFMAWTSLMELRLQITKAEQQSDAALRKLAKLAMKLEEVSEHQERPKPPSATQ